MLRTESMPARLKNGGEPEGGPNAYALEKLKNRAYPGTDIPLAFAQAARQSMARVHAESMAGMRGPVATGSWTALGPTTALYPAVLGRTGAAYVASGRISALAMSPVCTSTRCRLYVGAAGGGVWRTDKALSNSPAWTQITDGSFSTNAIGTISIDPTDATGNTLYVAPVNPTPARIPAPDRVFTSRPTAATPGRSWPAAPSRSTGPSATSLLTH